MRIRTRQRARAAMAAALLVVGLGVVPVARADPFAAGPPDSGPLADSALHNYCWGPGFDVALRDNADYAMQTSLDGATDMSDQFVATCDAVNTDVWWFDADLPDGIRGEYKCVTWVTLNVKCNSSDVTLDPVQINIGNFDEEDTSKSACHEVGHSVGLTHGGSTDCMLSGGIPNTNVQ